MILAQYFIEGATTPVTICPLGDIQWNGDRTEIAYDHLQEHIKQCLERPNPLFIGMGDYVDFMSPSNRGSLAGARLYAGPRKAIGDKALDLVLGVYDEILYPTKGKWLGMLSGHHWFPLTTGGNTDTRLCEALEAPYLGQGGAIVRLTFKEKTKTQNIDIWAHHGCGYGARAAVQLYKLENISNYWQADIFLMGHHTKKAVGFIDRMIPVYPHKGEPRLAHKTIHLVGTGGWSKGYIEGGLQKGKRPPYPTYVEESLLNPVTLGAPIIHIQPRWRHLTKGGTTVWEPVIRVEA